MEYTLPNEFEVHESQFLSVCVVRNNVPTVTHNRHNNVTSPLLKTAIRKINNL